MYPTTVEAKITNDYKEDLITIGHSYIEDDKVNKFNPNDGIGGGYESQQGNYFR